MSIPPVLFLHLGAHKIGTMALQGLFRAEAASLARAGVAAQPMQAFNRRFTRRTPLWRRAPAAAEPEMRTALLSLLPPGPPARALLVSDEALAGHVRSDLGNAPDRLYQHCGEIPRLLRRVAGGQRMVLILFIRRLGAFLEAAWLQLVRLGETQPFAAYRAGFDLERLSLVPTVEELAGTLVGPEDELLVYDHDWLRRDPDALLADLFGRLGAPAPAPGRAAAGRERLLLRGGAAACAALQPDLAARRADAAAARGGRADAAPPAAARPPRRPVRGAGARDAGAAA